MSGKVELNRINDKLYGSYVEPTLMTLVSVESQTKQAFLKFLTKSVEELEERWKELQAQEKFGQDGEACIDFSFMGKRIKINLKDVPEKMEIVAFSQLPSNICQIAEHYQVSQYLESIVKLPEQLKKEMEEFKGQPGKILERVFIILSEWLENFSFEKIRDLYTKKLLLSQSQGSLSNETLIQIMDKLVLHYINGYCSIVYAVVQKLKPILSFYRPTTKPIACLSITDYSSELYMSYFVNRYKEREISDYFLIVNSSLTYLEAFKIVQEEKQKDFFVFLKKFTYIQDGEIKQINEWREGKIKQ